MFFSCVYENSWQPPENPIPCLVAGPIAHAYAVGCCRSNFCAPSLNLTFEPEPTEPFGPNDEGGVERLNPGLLAGTIVGIVVILVVAALLIFGFVRPRWLKKRRLFGEDSKP